MCLQGECCTIWHILIPRYQVDTFLSSTECHGRDIRIGLMNRNHFLHFSRRKRMQSCTGNAVTKFCLLAVLLVVVARTQCNEGMHCVQDQMCCGDYGAASQICCAKTDTCCDAPGPGGPSPACVPPGFQCCFNSAPMLCTETQLCCQAILNDDYTSVCCNQTDVCCDGGTTGQASCCPPDMTCCSSEDGLSGTVCCEKEHETCNSMIGACASTVCQEIGQATYTGAAALDRSLVRNASACCDLCTTINANGYSTSLCGAAVAVAMENGTFECTAYRDGGEWLQQSNATLFLARHG